MTARPTLLFVHGAWHGAWCWEPLLSILDARGWKTVAIDLPTVHSADKAELKMTDDAAAVTAAIDAIEGDVVVVAHSYGGIPVTQAATSPKVRHIVYIAAFVLDAGESLFGSVGSVQPDWWTIDDDGLVTAGTPGHPPRDLFFADVVSDRAAASAGLLTPQPMAAFTEELSRVAWRDRATTYVVTERDAIFPLAAQEGLAARAGSAVVHVDSSHSPFLSQPEQLAAIVETAANV